MGLSQSNQFICYDFIPDYQDILPCENYRTFTESKLYALGEICERNSDSNKSLEFFKMAAAKKCVRSIEKLAKYYLKADNLDLALEYLHAGSSCKSIECIEQLVSHYTNINNREATEKFLLLGSSNGSIECMRKYGDFLAESSDSHAAKKYYSKAAAAGCSESMIALGKYCLNTQDYTKAEEWFAKSLAKLNPSGALNLARYYKTVSSNSDLAIKYYIQAIGLGMEFVNEELGNYLWEKNLRDRAVQHYLVIWNKDASLTKSQILARLGEYWLGCKDQDQALKYLLEIKSHYPQYPNIAYSIASIYEINGNQEQMIVYLKKVIDWDGLGSYEDILVSSALKLGEYYNSIDDYGNMDLMCKLIATYKPDYIQVKNMYTRYWDLKSNKTDLESIEQVAQHYRLIGNTSLMKKYLLMGIELGSVTLMEELADYYATNGQMDRAVKWWVKAITSLNPSVKSMEQLGLYYKSIGSLDLMAENYNLALNAGYSNPKIITDLAEYYEANGLDDEAYKCYLML